MSKKDKTEPRGTVATVPVWCRFDEGVTLEKLVPHPRNYNKHPDTQIALLAKIIKAQGWRNPVVVSSRSGFVVKGHGRIEAARLMQVGAVPVEYQDYETEAAEYADMIADNRIAELAEPDSALLKDLLQELATGEMDMDLTGFDAGELEKLMLQFNPEDETEADAEPQVDRAETLNEKWNVKPGDLWLIGDHRLLCGDSTKAADVARLLGDRRPVLMVTDPPYGVEYENEKGAVTNDERCDWYEAYCLFAGAVAYVWHAERTAIDVGVGLRRAGFDVRGRVVWVKPSLTMGRGHYHFQHEGAWYAVRKGATSGWCGDHKQSTVWQLDREDHQHPTVKPLECMARPMRNHDAAEVYDPFLGSGTTMVAAQNLGRKCYGLEIAPKYCAVILERMITAFPEIDIRKG